MARLAITTPLDVRVLEKAMSIGEALAAFNAQHSHAGAIASFAGRVRPDDSVHALELSHYEPLTLPGMESLSEETCRRFSLDGLLCWHRIGRLTPGQPIVLVAAASAHRREAIEAVDFAMDHLKSAAWFWKRERRADGWHWIEPRARDYADRARWEKDSAI